MAMISQKRGKAATQMDANVSEGLRDLEGHFRSEGTLGSNFRAVNSLREAARELVKEGEDASSIYYEHYCSSYDAYVTLLNATNERFWDMEESDLVPWTHKSFIPLPREKSFGEPYIRSAEIEEAIAIYLGTNIRCDALDRLLIDAAIAAEILAFFDSPQSKRYRRKWRYLWIDWVIIAALLWLANGAMWAWLVSVCVFAFPFVTGFLARGTRAKTSRLVLGMLEAYRYLGGSMTSVKELRLQLERSRDNGAVWLSSMWVLLEDIEARRKSL